MAQQSPEKSFTRHLYEQTTIPPDLEDYLNQLFEETTTESNPQPAHD